MKSVSEATVCIIDNGLFFPLAQRLAKDYKRVLYYATRRHGFALLNECVVGDGYADVERIDDFWKVKRDIDLFVFPDIEHAGLQLELEAQGFPVWGSRDADSIEIYRTKFMRALADAGLSVPRFRVVKGIDGLRTHLVDEEDKWIKISKFRGSMETWHWRNYRQDAAYLDVLAVRFGKAANSIKFMVFDAIETDLEIGGDTYCIDGQFPDFMVNGLEWKDKGYLASVLPASDMPEQVVAVNEAFSNILEPYRYRNLWSTEIRVAGDDFYFIDPCCRFPCPANESQLELYKNFSEIVWAGAHGDLVQPEIEETFAAQCVLTAKRDKSQWAVAEFSDELKPYVKCSGCCEIDGAYCFPPDDKHDDEIGWLVTTGNTISDTISKMKELTGKLPDGVCANTQSLFDLLKEAKSAESQGINFSDDKVPEPSTALDDE